MLDEWIEEENCIDVLNLEDFSGKLENFEFINSKWLDDWLHVKYDWLLVCSRWLDWRDNFGMLCKIVEEQVNDNVWLELLLEELNDSAGYFDWTEE